MKQIQAIHTILYVADQARSTEFYEKVLEMKPRLNVPGMTEFALGENFILGLMPERGIERLVDGKIMPSNARNASRAEIYLIVDAPEECHARALAAGARELSAFEKRNWGDTVAYSLDLDQHVLAFAKR